jgi:hypothetical protein
VAVLLHRRPEYAGNLEHSSFCLQFSFPYCIEVSACCFCAGLACAQFLLCSGAMVLKYILFLLGYCLSVFVKCVDFSHELLSYSIPLQIIITWILCWDLECDGS